MAKSPKPTVAKSEERRILVYADWAWLKERPALMGSLYASSVRGSEVFSFEYDRAWLKGTAAQILDPELSFFGGRQYAKAENFGLFMDSSPDRWGRTVMQRREALEAKAEGRAARTLTSSDYLLGVADAHRAGALRFKRGEDGPFLDDRVPADHPSPPIATIRELEAASEEIERGGRIEKPEQVQLLLAPGGSLGGSRPKSGVVDTDGSLWIAKFPSRNDTYDMGAWEEVGLLLAKECGIAVSDGYSRK
ncbi:MAG: type II toxin-antitoxin system HipA family toxin, partial [Woeseiaceae bacterium]